MKKQPIFGYRRVPSKKNQRDLCSLKADSVSDAREQLKIKIESEDIKYISEEWKLIFYIESGKLYTVRCEL